MIDRYYSWIVGRRWLLIGLSIDALILLLPLQDGLTKDGIYTNCIACTTLEVVGDILLMFNKR